MRIGGNGFQHHPVDCGLAYNDTLNKPTSNTRITVLSCHNIINYRLQLVAC
ncbi:hypothetical protein O9992_02770 [Vibrio lentus]|nr:hypothetical protein [Vibrio lentus]